MSPGLIQYLIPIPNAGSLFGLLLSNFLGDKLGHYNTFTVVRNMTGIWILGLWLPHSTDASLIVLDALFGLFSVAYASFITRVRVASRPLPLSSVLLGRVCARCPTPAD
jgi:MFS transporter, MCT family, aspergillic acid transporter